MVKKGDTLIEVILAIGIFSMVAIAVVSVMNGGVSSAGTALETTLAREEIDIQAEALRFIHDAYMYDQNSNIGQIWNQITEGAVDKFTAPECNASNFIDTLKDKAFFIDVNNFKDNTDKVYTQIKDTNYKDTDSDYPYPQIVPVKDPTSGLDKMTSYGIYVVATSEGEASVFDGTTFQSGSVYYNFLIQTCWYGAGEDISSTISTVVRLNNPELASIINGTTPSGGGGGSGGSGGGTPTPETPETSPKVTIEYNSNGGSGTTTGTELSNESAFNSYQLSPNTFTAPNPDTQEFNGWRICIGSNCVSTLAAANTYLKDKISYPTSDTTITIYAQWKDKPSTPPSVTPTFAMTTITKNDINSLADKTEVNLTNSDKTYKGIKYKGRIWMMESITTGTVYYTSASSQCPTNWGLPIKSEVDTMQGNSDSTVFTDYLSWTNTATWAFRIITSTNKLVVSTPSSAKVRCVFPST